MTVLEVSLDNLLGVSKLQDVLKRIVDKLNEHEASTEARIREVLANSAVAGTSSELEQRLDALRAEFEEKYAPLEALGALDGQVSELQDGLATKAELDQCRAELEERISGLATKDALEEVTANLAAPSDAPGGSAGEGESLADCVARLGQLEDQLRKLQDAGDANLEHLEERFKVYAAANPPGQLTELADRFAELEARQQGGLSDSALDELEERLQAALSTGLKDVHAKLGEAQAAHKAFAGVEAVNQLSSDLQSHAGKLQGLSALSEELQQALSLLQGETADRTQGQVSALEERAAALEAALEQVRSTLQAHQDAKTEESEKSGELSSLREALAALEAVISKELKPQYDSMQAKATVTDNTTRLEIRSIKDKLNALMDSSASATTRCLSCVGRRDQHQSRTVMVGADGKVYRKRISMGATLDSLDSPLARDSSVEFYDTPQGLSSSTRIHLQGGAGAPLRHYRKDGTKGTHASSTPSLHSLSLDNRPHTDRPGTVSSMSTAAPLTMYSPERPSTSAFGSVDRPSTSALTSSLAGPLDRPSTEGGRPANDPADFFGGKPPKGWHPVAVASS